MNITIFTIAFNGYGQFVSDWLDSILNQTIKPNEIIIVLGINHNTPKDVIKKAEQNNVKIIYETELRSMGNLINQAISLSQSEWLLRVDVDDILLPNAIQEVKNKSLNCDAVSLKFLRDGIEINSPIPEQDKMMNWRKHYKESGYVALKKQFNSNVLYYDDNDFPNFPYLFKAFSLGMKFELTDNPCSVYQKRKDSHSTTLRTPEQNKEAYRIIDEAVSKYSNNNIKLSIIVPVYNTEKYIKRCLQSIELRNDIEIIIIDDYSTDNSANIIKQWIEKVKFNNIVFIQNSENLGVGATVNKGYDVMRGEYTMTLCDDDYLLEPISKLINELDGTDLIYYNMINNNGRVWQGMKLPGSTKAYKKSIIGNTRRVDQNFGGDKIFYQEILKKNPTKKDTGLLLYYYNYPRVGSLMDVWKSGKIVCEETNVVQKSDVDTMDITIFTIVYNNYGQFLPQWIRNIKKQTRSVSNIVIVLGNNHNVDLDYVKFLLQDVNYKIIEYNDTIMGILRNQAVKIIDTEWMFYFSVDDELLPHAIDEIYKKSLTYDVVSLYYISMFTNGNIETHNSICIDAKDIINSTTSATVPGYIATKTMFNNEKLFYENIDIPNYPYAFYLASLGMKFGLTDDICAIYHRRENSHGDKAKKNKEYLEYRKYINDRAIYYTESIYGENYTINALLMNNIINISPKEYQILNNQGLVQMINIQKEDGEII